MLNNSIAFPVRADLRFGKATITKIQNNNDNKP